VRRFAIPAWTLLPVALGVFVAGFAIARETGACSAPRAGDAPPADTSLPPMTTGGYSGTSRHVGSVFRSRVTAADTPFLGVEMVLVSPRRDESLEGCPLCVRVLGGERGGKLLSSLVLSFGAEFDALEGKPLPATFADELRTTVKDLVGHARAGSRDGPSPSLRALFLGLPRPDVDARTSCVGVALYTHGDPHFDSGTSTLTPGVRLTMARLERAHDDDSRVDVLAGAIEVARVGEASRAASATEDDPRVMDVFSNLRSHFGDPPAWVQGLYLDRAGTVYAYGPDLRLQPLPEAGELRETLKEILRRI